MRLVVLLELHAASGSSGLDAYLDLTIEEGTGGEFNDCTLFTPTSAEFTGTLPSFAATYTDFASGVGAWTPADSLKSRIYRFTMTLQDKHAAQGMKQRPLPGKFGVRKYG